MLWKCYKVKLKSESPVHMGYRSLGIISQTRYYIPAKTLWAVLTAYITKNHREVGGWQIRGDNPTNMDYQKVGKEISQNIRFSYFYVCEDGKPLHPFYTQEGINYGDGRLTKEQFEAVFISSFASTAIDRDSGTALEEMGEGKGSLHEVEFIKPQSEFTGYCFVKNGFKIDKKLVGEELLTEILNEALSSHGLGGERNYGYGKMKVIVPIKESKEPDIVREADSERLNKKPVPVDLENLSVKLKKDKLYVSSSPINIANMEHLFSSIFGKIEPIIGREWSDNTGAGRGISNALVVLEPGTRFMNNSEADLSIQEHGILGTEH